MKIRRIRVAPIAAQQIADIHEWWRLNRTAAPNLFLDELDRAYELIRYQPNVGQSVVGAQSEVVRRVRLRRSGYYLYYREPENGDTAIDVLALWHTSRGSGPNI